MAAWRSLDEGERRHLEDLVRVFLADKRWEGSRGFELTEKIRVLIAAQACLLLLGLDHDHYRTVRTIVVHPSTIVLSGPRSTGIPGVVVDGPMPIAGQTSATGPVLLAWNAVSDGARHPERGHNVVYHEFAHRLDMLDGVVNGTPPLPDRETVKRWVEVCTRVYEQVKSGVALPPMRDYAAVSPAEFFAVATEGFFDRPTQLQALYPDLYDVLAGFYRQDPAARHRRAAPGPVAKPGSGPS